VSRAPRWYEEGKEPDYRFTLANERTFLAWLRTGLALLAGAAALTQFVPRLSGSRMRTYLAILLALAGTGLAALAYRRWAMVQRAMREEEPLPMTWLPFVVGCVTSVAGVAVIAMLVVDLR
jgi:inner membrane protein YidH